MHNAVNTNFKHKKTEKSKIKNPQKAFKKLASVIQEDVSHNHNYGRIFHWKIYFSGSDVRKYSSEQIQMNYLNKFMSVQPPSYCLHQLSDILIISKTKI